MEEKRWGGREFISQKFEFREKDPSLSLLSVRSHPKPRDRHAICLCLQARMKLMKAPSTTMSMNQEAQSLMNRALWKK